MGRLSGGEASAYARTHARTHTRTHTHSSIQGFMQKSDAEKLLLQCSPGTFLIRFSEGDPGGVSVAWVTGTRVLRMWALLESRSTMHAETHTFRKELENLTAKFVHVIYNLCVLYLKYCNNHTQTGVLITMNIAYE